MAASKSEIAALAALAERVAALEAAVHSLSVALQVLRQKAAPVKKGR